jgi:cysteine synthase
MAMPMKAVASALRAIGNTPLVRLRKVVPPNAADVFVKLEYYSPTGSYKGPLVRQRRASAGKEAHKWMLT